MSAGYVYLGRWRRAVTALAFTAGLLVLASSLGAASNPRLWLAMVGVWVLWMVRDAWRQGRRLQRLPGAARGGRSWPPVLAAVLLVVLMAFGFAQYRAAGERAFDAALAAHQDGDCQEAIDRYSQVSSAYELTLGSYVGVADANVGECELFLLAERAHRAEDHPAALEHYEAYLTDHPDGPLVARVRSGLAETHYRYAGALAEQASGVAFDEAEELYRQAFDQYATLREEYPDSGEAEAVPETVTDLYDTATRPLAEEQYCEAVPILDIFASLSGDEAAPATAAAEEALPQALYRCGLDRYDDGAYANALEYLRRLSDTYPDSPLTAEARTTLIAAEVANIRDGSTGELPPPQEVGRTAGGNVTVEIVNDSPETLELLFSGPQADIVTIPACPDCTNYPFNPPIACEAGSEPRVTLQLTPGGYDMVVRAESAGGVTPYSGSWDLKAGTAYSNCFYIVTSFG